MTYFLENLAHTNPNITLNLYWAKIWLILLNEWSQGPTPKYTCSTELKSSFPLSQSWFVLSFRSESSRHCLYQTVRAGEMKVCSPPTMCHMSRVTCHVWHVACLVSCVRCQVSHVRCHVSHFFLQKLLSESGEGLTHLIL